MRLLHTQKHTLEKFESGCVPRYAILSHTWGEEEVLFQDINPSLDVAKQKKGWPKVAGSCEVARRLGYEYIWIDTLCIDKTNNVELGKAINMMFEWYALADICLTYIADFVVDDARSTRTDFLKSYVRPTSGEKRLGVSEC